MCKIKNCKKTKKLMNNFCHHVIFVLSSLKRAFIVKDFSWCRKNCPLNDCPLYRDFSITV